MKIILLRSITFEDDPNEGLIQSFIESAAKNGHLVQLINFPFSESKGHWQGLRLCDLNRACDKLICINFPAALPLHRNKVIIINDNRKFDKQFDKVIRVVLAESQVCYLKSDEPFPKELMI